MLFFMFLCGRNALLCALLFLRTYTYGSYCVGRRRPRQRSTHGELAELRLCVCDKAKRHTAFY